MLYYLDWGKISLLSPTPLTAFQIIPRDVLPQMYNDRKTTYDSYIHATSDNRWFYTHQHGSFVFEFQGRLVAEARRYEDYLTVLTDRYLLYYVLFYPPTVLVGRCT